MIFSKKTTRVVSIPNIMKVYSGVRYKRDHNARLNKEATKLMAAFNQDTFKGYSLLKQQHRKRSKAVLPPEGDFTAHYRAHYQLGGEDPLEIHSCDLPPSPQDDTLTRDDFDSGVKKLNANRQAGLDNVAPEFVKHSGPVLLQWLFTLITRIWTFASSLRAIFIRGREQGWST